MTVCVKRKWCLPLLLAILVSSTSCITYVGDNLPANPSGDFSGQTGLTISYRINSSTYDGGWGLQTFNYETERFLTESGLFRSVRNGKGEDYHLSFSVGHEGASGLGALMAVISGFTFTIFPARFTHHYTIEVDLEMSGYPIKHLRYEEDLIHFYHIFTLFWMNKINSEAASRELWHRVMKNLMNDLNQAGLLVSSPQHLRDSPPSRRLLD